MMFRCLALGCGLSLVASLVGCGSSRELGDDEGASEDALVARASDAWFYDGPLSALDDANVTVSLKGHTARVTGYLPAGSNVGYLPHVRTRTEDGRLRVDAVYPIATARPGKSNSPVGRYEFQLAKPYRPDGTAITRQEGEHWVTWGGYPFVAYNGGIAFHGPITATDSAVAGAEENVWYLQRGPVSGGCNRMLPEHVVEFTHVIGVSMRKVYDANRMITPTTETTVDVIAGYDELDGKFVDVDYPTWSGATRPAKAHGADKVTMFGSWIATETPDGSDLPTSMRWEGGVTGKYYVFAEHATEGRVCSVQKRDIAGLKTLAKRLGGELPKGFCAKRDCVISALRASKDAKTTCRL